MPSSFVIEMFGAASAGSNGVVRRSKADVQRLGVLNEIIATAQANEWHVLESETQIIVLCNSGALKILA